MRRFERLWLTWAALLGFASVAFGAFAAHGISDPHAKDLLHTGSNYAALHAVAAIAWMGGPWSGRRGAAAPSGLMLTGATIFAGSIWALALGAPQGLGAVTPIGGVTLLAGWGAIAWIGARS